MKTQLARSTAGLALVVSMMSAAHANEAAPNIEVDVSVYGPTIDLEESVKPSDFILADSASDEREEERSDNVDGYQTDLELPVNLFAAFDALEGQGVVNAELSVAPALPGRVEMAPVKYHTAAETGVVTLRGLSPFYGDINPFYGDIDAFWGDIDAFWGDINPFYGDIDAFWGDINPFWGDIDAFWGDIDAFYGDIDAFNASNLNALGTFWQQHSAQIAVVESKFAGISFDANGGMVRDGSPQTMFLAMQDLIAQGSAQFGAEYTSRTGNDFSVLVEEIFARHGANPNLRSSFEYMTEAQRGALFLDWHDSINQYSGVDAVDHWMATINWTPELTQIQGNGRDTIIGIIDGSFSTDTDLGNNIVWAGGYDNYVGGHGAGVASLIAGAHDGQGVMGIAPDVNIATYNPFNPNGGSGWGEVKTGILAMQPNGLKSANQFGRTSIINMSLGEKGWMVTQGLADIFTDSEIKKVNRDTVYVIASGNEGVTQNTDVEWYYGKDAPVTIFVGSVNPNGEISSFSNRPGSTCLLDNGVCNAGNELYMRTIVAPGEMILMSDGLGGVTRHSGTSFSAPLVSGAIALLHDRWQWLADHPEASAEIIFRSARDLGAPGPDEVYGWGLLDVQASQSPLDFNAMSFRFHEKLTGQGFSASSTRTMSPAAVLSAGSIPRSWDASDLFLVAFENVGDTHRDFSIPLAGLQNTNTTDALGRGHERFQSYVTQRFTRWLNSGGSDRNGDGRAGFSELQSSSTDLNGEWSFRIDAMQPQLNQDGTMRLVHGAATLVEPSGKASFTAGFGQGAMALSSSGFGIISDHDPMTGGVNPILGFASGDSFVQAGYKIFPNTKISVGFAENRDRLTNVQNLPEELALQRQLRGERPANAFTLDVAQQVSSNVSVSVQYTMLDEESSMLGTQGGSQLFMGGGAQTEAMTVSAGINFGQGFSLDVSATGARTETARDQVFTNDGAVFSTAGQVSAMKRGLFSKKDALRLTVAQPLQIEAGSLQFTSDQVIDRSTGEIGAVTQTFGIETQRRYTGEMVYATQLSNSTEFSAFTRYTSAGDSFDEAGFVLGGNFNFRF